jgi:hypothetical protein
VKGKYFQPITSTAPKITTTTEIDLTFTWSSKKCYGTMLLPSKFARFLILLKILSKNPQKTIKNSKNNKKSKKMYKQLVENLTDDC